METFSPLQKRQKKAFVLSYDSISFVKAGPFPYFPKALSKAWWNSPLNYSGLRKSVEELLLNNGLGRWKINIHSFFCMFFQRRKLLRAPLIVNTPKRLERWITMWTSSWWAFSNKFDWSWPKRPDFRAEAEDDSGLASLFPETPDRKIRSRGENQPEFASGAFWAKCSGATPSQNPVMICMYFEPSDNYLLFIDISGPYLSTLILCYEILGVMCIPSAAVKNINLLHVF